MAHGSKKWIVAYDGKVKRSNDRTKKDFYRDLFDWEPIGGFRNMKSRHSHFCPQCKHNYKWVKAYNDAFREEQRRIEREWEEYIAEEVKAWKRRWIRFVSGVSEDVGPDPRHDWKRRWKFRRARQTLIGPIYDEETYLCPKCRTKWEHKEDTWRRPDMPGRKKHYTWVRRHEYQKHRAKVKQALRDERYEDIFRGKRGWLD